MAEGAGSAAAPDPVALALALRPAQPSRCPLRLPPCMEPRFFSPAEAIAVLPRLKPLLVEIRDAFHEYKTAREQWQELVAWGEGESDEAARLREATEAQGQRVQSLVDEVTALGADVKDPLLGLVDFYHRRGDGSIVLLCYRDDEDTIRFWHPPETGFAGRKPLSDL